MPKVNIARKSTDTDMTPFVDIAFLILSFFIMATKMKAPEPVETTPPKSVSAKSLPTDDAVLITMDKENRVFISILSEHDPVVVDKIIADVNNTRSLNLSGSQVASLKKSPVIGVPFQQLGAFLNLSAADQTKYKQPGIPVTDSATNELVWWIAASKKAFAGSKLKFLIKGDADAHYPTFEGVIDALKRNEEFKYNLVTSLEQAPAGTDLYNARQNGTARKQQ
jgi:biopolymer transport protein ExbD